MSHELSVQDNPDGTSSYVYGGIGVLFLGGLVGLGYYLRKRSSSGAGAGRIPDLPSQIYTPEERASRTADLEAASPGCWGRFSALLPEVKLRYLVTMDPSLSAMADIAPYLGYLITGNEAQKQVLMDMVIKWGVSAQDQFQALCARIENREMAVPNRGWRRYLAPYGPSVTVFGVAS